MSERQYIWRTRRVTGTRFPTSRQISPDAEARLAMAYYRDQIVNASSPEEIRGIKMDIDNDSRLTFGERARALKYANTQISLIQLQHSEQL